MKIAFDAFMLTLCIIGMVVSMFMGDLPNVVMGSAFATIWWIVMRFDLGEKRRRTAAGDSA